jgi:4a-hydroxytetrahydrobiopterin dehydratase
MAQVFTEGEMMSDLSTRTCEPCRGGVPPLSIDRVQELLEQVGDWEADENHYISRSFKFPDFQAALEFVNRVGAIAEEQGHHPDFYLSYGLVRVDIWTHKIDGLTESDFVLAAKIDKLAPS